MFFKKKKLKNTPEGMLEETLANLHLLVLEASENVHSLETELSSETQRKLTQLRMEVREAHQSLELIDYCLKQKRE